MKKKSEKVTQAEDLKKQLWVLGPDADTTAMRFTPRRYAE